MTLPRFMSRKEIMRRRGLRKQHVIDHFEEYKQAHMMLVAAVQRDMDDPSFDPGTRVNRISRIPKIERAWQEFEQNPTPATLNAYQRAVEKIDIRPLRVSIAQFKQHHGDAVIAGVVGATLGAAGRQVGDKVMAKTLARMGRWWQQRQTNGPGNANPAPAPTT